MSEFKQYEANQRADLFARAFVMPRDRFMEVVGENTSEDKCDVKAVAERFGVSYWDVLLRGIDLHLWGWTTI